MPSRRFGPYDITGHLGAGGMGEVYRAHDSRLGRDVAIKLLPEAFMRDAERLARFDREARALAALSHPNIGAIFGVEEADERRGLVLELVEGLTLDEMIAVAAETSPSGTVPLPEVLRIAAQIADALEAAHDRGIVHRDLKPANIKMTPQGLVKVLDFGLAKATTDGAAVPADSTMSLEHGLTRAGLAMGTPRYMSPEQARGLRVGAQADIWAFGCVLFESLTGRPPFDGPSVADTIAAVLGGEPEWSRLPAATPAPIRRLLRRCLQKSVQRRLKHIGDARLEIEDALAADEARDGPWSPPVGMTSIEVKRLTDSVGMKESPAVSPDGKMVAFTAIAGGARQIWVQLVAGGAALQVTRDAADHDEPRWDADSSRLIFHAPAKGAGLSGSLCEVSAFGVAPRRVMPAVNGGDVSRDGTRLALFRKADDRTELVVAARDGSSERVIAKLPSDQHGYLSPRWSPDDRAIAFARASLSFETHLFIVPSDGGEPFSVIRGDWIRGHAWRPDGSGLVYSASRGSTMPYPPAQNLRTVDRDGTRDRPLTFGDASYLEPDADPFGRLAASRMRSRSDIWSFPVAGSPVENARAAQRITEQTGQVQTPSVSPDGSEVAYVSDHGGHSNIWVCGLDGTGVRQITFERDPDTVIGVAHWSPRGDWLVFISARHGRIDLRLVPPDGGNPRTLITDAYGAYWSGDGSWVYCTRGGGQLVKVSVDEGTIVDVRSDRSAGPAIAPDGSTLYFVTRPADPFSTRANWELRRARPEDGPSDVIGLIAGARLPLAPRFIPHFHISPDGRWLAIPLIDGATTNIWAFPTDGGPPRQITDFGERATLLARWVSWSPDGSRVFAAVAEIDVDVVLLDGVF